MATRGKNPRRSTGRATQPKTIDLSASEVKKTEAKEEAASNAPASAGGAKQSAKPATSSKKPASSAKAPENNPTSSPVSSNVGGQKKDDSSASGKSQAGAVSKPEKQSSAGFGSLAAAAILGGVVTAGGLGGIGQLNNAGSIPLIGSLYSTTSEPAASDGQTEISKQISAISDRISKIEAVPELDVSSDIASLKEGLSSLGEKLANIPEATEDGINELVQNNSQTLQSLSSALESLKNDAGSIADSASSALSSELETLGSGLSDLKSQVEEFVSKNNPVDPQLLEKLQQRAQDLEKQLQEFMSGQEEKIDSISNQVETLNTRLDSEILPQFSTIKQAAENAKAGQKVARSVAVASLQGALNSGASYLGALSSLETLDGPTEQTSRLRELAETASVPTITDLATQFTAMAPQLVATNNIATENAGVMDRLLSGARSLVSVRPSGPVQGNTPTAIVSRIEANLNGGNLADVVTEWQNLPEENQAVGSSWIEGIKLRLETNTLLRQVITGASGAVEQG